MLRLEKSFPLPTRNSKIVSYYISFYSRFSELWNPRDFLRHLNKKSNLCLLPFRLSRLRPNGRTVISQTPRKHKKEERNRKQKFCFLCPKKVNKFFFPYVLIKFFVPVLTSFRFILEIRSRNSKNFINLETLKKETVTFSKQKDRIWLIFLKSRLLAEKLKRKRHSISDLKCTHLKIQYPNRYREKRVEIFTRKEMIDDRVLEKMFLTYRLYVWRVYLTGDREGKREKGKEKENPFTAI